MWPDYDWLVTRITTGGTRQKHWNNQNSHATPQTHDLASNKPALNDKSILDEEHAALPMSSPYIEHIDKVGYGQI